jgi:hypothetical protein
MKRLAILAGGTIALWALLIYPGLLLSGQVAWIHSLVALSLCLLPALGTLGWVILAGGPSEKQLVAVLGGVGIRLVIAMGGGLLLFKRFPDTFTDIFWLWMGLFYMFILAVETALVVRYKPGGTQ